MFNLKKIAEENIKFLREHCGVYFESPYDIQLCSLCGEPIKVTLEKTKKSDE